MTCRLPDDSPIYTAELRAILLALNHVYCSKEISFLILSDSLSSLKAVFNLKYGHPILVQIPELCIDLTKEGKVIVFIWVPGHVDIRGNSAADSAAKDALVGDIPLELIPFSDLKDLYKQTCSRPVTASRSGMSSRKRNCIKSVSG